MHAAVHFQGGAGEETGEVGSKKQRAAADLLGHADAAHWNLWREALRRGEVKGMSANEIKARAYNDPTAPAARHGWRMWVAKAGVAELLSDEDR